MPELPDVVVYVERLIPRVVGQPLESVRIASPFLLRSVTPTIADAQGKTVTEVRRLGKRIAIGVDGGIFIVIHLMIAGRLRWRPPGTSVPAKVGLAAFDFPTGALLFTEQGTKRRASLHLAQGEDGLMALAPPGLEVLEADPSAFREALTRENHTLKRALTDPHLFSGIGNAYSDEILHGARLSPARLTRQMGDEEIERLYHACRETLLSWTERLRQEAGAGFPETVTAFRESMAVHGRYRQPCPRCGAPVQRIVYAEHEANYCAACQTGGRLLADRALSRLLRDDWPRTLDQLEATRPGPIGRSRPTSAGVALAHK